MNKFLGYILGIETPSGSSMVSIETVPMYFSFILAALSVIALLIISLRLYRAEQIKLPSRIKAFAICSRFAAIFAFCMLFFQPLSCNLKLKGTRPSPNILILDDSLSMQSRDNRIEPDDISRAEALVGKITIAEPGLDSATKYPSRIELAKAVFNDKTNGFLKTLETKGPLKKYIFGNDLKRLGEKADPLVFLEDWQGNQPRSLLADSIEKAISNTTEPPSSVIIFTDGRDTNSSANLNEIAKLPASQQSAARAEFEEMDKVFAEVRDLPREERRAKMEEIFSRPEMQDRMDDRRLSRDELRTPEQRMKRYRKYVERKQEAQK